MVRLSTTCTQKAALIVFVYLMYGVYIIYKLNNVETTYVGLFPLTAEKAEFSSYSVKNRFVNSKDLLLSICLEVT